MTDFLIVGLAFVGMCAWGIWRFECYARDVVLGRDRFLKGKP